MIKKAKKLEWKEVDDEIIAFNPKKDEFFVLNKTGSFIWKKINGKNNEKKIAESLAKECNIKEKKAFADTKQLIKKLVSRKLVVK
ncbi:MAG: PqqD family protein [Candidatus Micrarchaeota archaeon]